MLNDNKISEIKIIIDGLVKDIDSLSEEEMISHLKWEEILMSASLISHKLNTLRIEQERNHMKKYLLMEDANNQFDSNDNEFKRLSYTISQLKKEMSDMRLNVSKSILGERNVSGLNEVDQDILEFSKSDFFEQQIEHRKSKPDIEQPDIEPEPPYIEEQPSSVSVEMGTKENELEVDQDELNVPKDELDFLLDKRSLMDIAVPYSSVPEWMKDMPGAPVEELHMAVTLNDKLFFIRELFHGDEDRYSLSMEKLNGFNSFKEALEYTRGAFNDWDEESDAVYRFYMILRRRYNG